MAVVGDNGSGKSTLAKCLTGLFTPSAGYVSYNKIDIRRLPKSEVFKRITVMFQDFAKYELTIKENITLSHPSGEDSDIFNRVVEQSHLIDLMQSFPDQELTKLGPSLNNGTELSGGQWQKIAFARALFKQAELVVLDEPTAAIDPISEAELLNSIVKYCKDKMALIITHRLAICTDVDKIIVLHDGEIVEMGSHEQLIALNGRYSRMFKAQADHYLKGGDIYVRNY
ncbi:hypothetical protein PCURB6_14350 [Paenibacillus curdlanolyticus]|nr:ATP-binding cassette domain-containing protein [Paenibacillus curdlanolyticus]GFN31175.1 hypothetical protein PCURB6_14350 [Paenibacillus curdlanolyticus]